MNRIWKAEEWAYLGMLHPYPIKPKEDLFDKLYLIMKGKTQQYYDKNAAARKVKAATDKKVNERPEQRKKRSELNKANRRSGSYGNGDKKDLSHTKNGLVLKSEKANRGSKKDQPGDKRARG